MPKLHPRYMIVEEVSRKAEAAFWDAIDNGPEKKALTYLEIIKIIGKLLDKAVMYGIRLERHPEEPNKKGDEE